MDKNRNYSGPVAKLPLAVAISALTLGSFTAQAQETASRGYSVTLEEVVVTAQKREENYMSVPAAVDAFTAQDMINTGAVNIQDMDDYMPGVEITDVTGGSTQVGITVRGVTSPNISSGQDPSTATFFDGSYMPRAVTSVPFTDIQRTEVLKGPQGTLFGRNATVGVINIIPNAPGDQFEGFLKSRLGNYNLVRLEGMVNAPITDDLAFRGNIFSNQRDGITSQKGVGDDVQDQGFIAARGSFLWGISDNTDLQFTMDYEDRDEMPRAAIGVSKYAYSQDPFKGKTAHDVVGQEETREMYGVSLKLNHDFNDRLSLFGVVSYRDWETTNLQEEDGTAAIRRYLDSNNIEDSDILYTEFRFNYVGDNFDVIVGANYSEEEMFQSTVLGITADSYMQFLTGVLGPEFGIPVDLDDHIWDLFPTEPDAFYEFVSGEAGVAVLPPSFAGQMLPQTLDNTGDFTNWGIFTDATYQLTDRVRIAAGLRYSKDDKDFTWQTYEADLDWPYQPAFVLADPAESGLPADQWFDKLKASDSWNKTTGRLVVDWEFSDTAMTYLSYATGYKSGGYDGQSFRSFQQGAFDPEDMTSIELGLKGDFFSDRLRVEAALFHQELDGRQRSVDVLEGPTAKPRVVSSDDETDGIELVLTWNIIDSLTVAGMTTYRESESLSEEYINADGELAGGTKDDSESGSEYTVLLDWTPEIASGYLLLHVDYVFREEEGPNRDAAIFETGKWYFQDEKKLNARVAWSDDSDTWEVALWGKNLTDEERAGNPGGFAARELGVSHTTIDDPRTYGVDVRYAF
jgi:iron complex outermembrane recepter protein